VVAESVEPVVAEVVEPVVAEVVEPVVAEVVEPEDFVILLPKPYKTDEIPKSIDKENIVFQEKEIIEVEIEPFIVNEKIKSKKKMTNNVSVNYDKETNLFSFKSKTGTYTLYDLLLVVYYLYSVCPETKQSLTIVTLTLQRAGDRFKLNLR
jgi:hypothetical protein